MSRVNPLTLVEEGQEREALPSLASGNRPATLGRCRCPHWHITCRIPELQQVRSSLLLQAALLHHSNSNFGKYRTMSTSTSAAAPLTLWVAIYQPGSPQIRFSTRRLMCLRIPHFSEHLILPPQMNVDFWMTSGDLPASLQF